ncbi:hypothetical protein L615_000600000780 [Nocardioides sp. J9]|uniref:hypothetical protein n=1 Tax=Nocardioides sp. J9 TaxID=935844 RepID=UPI0011A1AB09|nr:hypothetical protein [Nocardioides sp. J9]TWG93965.1 hypothetical protein L615_000600000780 [Nocardioides sp. J9]
MSVVLVAALLAAGVVWLIRVPVGLVPLAVPQLGFVGWGLADLSTRPSSANHLPYYLMALVLLVLGYSLAGPRGRSENSSPAAPLPKSAVLLVVLIAGALTTYHFAVGGIPLLSNQIERARFDFANSGLFGLPGRMYLFGSIFAWMLATVNGHVRGVRLLTDWTWILATTFLVVPALLSGFKGRLAYVAVVLIFGLVAVGARRITMVGLGRRYWWVAAILFLNFVAVAGLYATYAAEPRSGLTLLQDRLTVIAAEPAKTVLDWADAGHRPMMANDFDHLTRKYAGLDGGSGYTLEREVSTNLIGISPRSSGFAPPVTVGAIAELRLTFGSILGLLSILAVGVVLRRLEGLGNKSVLTDSARLFIALGVYTFAVRGGFAYYVLNFAAMTVLMAALTVACTACLRRSRSTEGARERPRTQRTAGSTGAVGAIGKEDPVQ